MRPADKTYRPDIDGLRAVAVLAVLVNHVFPSLLPSGFIGVDIFFVLSGYLITKIIVGERQRGTFSFGAFYVRRFRRIFPALGVVLAATWVLGAALFTATEFESLGRHIVAAGLFASNVLLWHEVGYFDVGAATKPLLHLWSLGVEEQFYLVWPSLVGLIAWRSTYRWVWLCTLGGASLILSVFLSQSHPEAGFYLLPARFWELLAGGALAFVHADGARGLGTGGGPRQPALLSMIGVCALLAAFTVIDESTPYPSGWALLPVVGTVALIAAGPGAVFNRLALSNRAAVWFGLISYPLYLWHWPLLTFVRLVGADVGLSVSAIRAFKLAAALLAIVLAYLTYRFVELPVQQRGKLRTASSVGRDLLRYATPLILLTVLGGATEALSGLPFRMASTGSVPATEMLREASRKSIEAHHAMSVRCATSDDDFMPTWCYRSRQAEPTVVVWGDSHAMALYSGLIDALPSQSVMLHAQSGCPSILIAPARDDLCIDANASALARIESVKTVQTVVLVARGPVYLGDRAKVVGPTNELVTKMKFAFLEREGVSVEAVYSEALERAISSLRRLGKRVVLVLDVPEFGFAINECVEGRPLGIRDLRKPCAVSTAADRERSGRYRNLVHEVSEKFSDLTIVDPKPVLCDHTACSGMSERGLYYMDDNHLSLLGSRLVGGTIGPVLMQTIDGAK